MRGITVITDRNHVFCEKLFGNSLSTRIRHSSSIKTKRMCLGAFEKNEETRDRDRDGDGDRDRDRQSRLDGFQMKTSLEGGYRCSVLRSRRTDSRKLSEGRDNVYCEIRAR